MNYKGLTYVNAALTIVLLAFVVMLYTGEKSVDVTNENVAPADSTVRVSNAMSPGADLSSMKIAYVNTDTLWAQYKFVKNTLKSLEAQQNRLQKQYEAKMTKLQNDYMDYRQNGASLSYAQQQAREADLKKQQDDIQKLEEEVKNKLIIRKQQLNNQINDTILAFINRYRVAKGYDFIFQYAYLNGILSASSDYDITDDVVSKLNEEYEKFNK